MNNTTTERLTERAAHDGLMAVATAIEHTTRYWKAGRFHVYGRPTTLAYDNILRWRMLPVHIAYYEDANRQVVAWRAYDMLSFKHRGLSGINIVAFWNIPEPPVSPTIAIAVDASDNAVFQSILHRMNTKYTTIVTYDIYKERYIIQ